MSINDKSFFTENITNINRMVSKILLATIFVPVMLAVLSYVGIFKVSLDFSITIFLSISVVSLIFNILIKFERFPKFTMYLGLIGINLFIAILGTHAHVGIYVSFGVPPLISCLYYNKKLSNTSCIVSYILMLISLYVKYTHSAPIFHPQIELSNIVNGEFTIKKSILQSYIPVAAGFTIEFLFIFLITNLLATRNYKTLKRLLALIDDRNGLISELKEKNLVIEHKNEEYEKKELELKDAQSKIIHFVAQNLKSHDLLTGFHVEHTKSYVELISKKLREQGQYTKELTTHNIELFSNAAFLHDIGKIHTPEGVLNKPGKFTVEEFEIIKRHPKDGAELIDLLPKIGNGEFNKIAHDIALYHHEKWDGTGYPNRLSGTDIPLCARIMAVADVMDALISLRTYKDPMPIEKAMRIFEESKGTQFEPCIVDAVVACKDEIERIDKSFKEKESTDFYKEVDEKHKYNEILREQIKMELEAAEAKRNAESESSFYSNNG